MSQIKNAFLWFLSIYQRFFTLFSFGSCRYYPTCSEYAKWQIEHNNFLSALFCSALRVLRCNQFFAGGIDYPKINKNRIRTPAVLNCLFAKKDVAVWFVPTENGKFFVVKRLNGIKK